MKSLTQDLRFSLRLMRKRPGMAFLVIAALALGIGLNTAIFSVLNAVVLRPLPLFQPDRIVWLHSKVNQTGGQLGTSYPDYLDWKAQTDSFDSIAAIYALSFMLTGNGPPEHVKATGISASGFRVWGIGTILGRDFTDADDRAGANRVVILTSPFWQRKFGGDPTVLGKSLVLDDQQYTIIGVLQPTPLTVLTYPDVYVANGPLLNSHLMERDTRWFFPVARLKPNVSIAQAQTEMDTIASRLAAQYPATNKDMGIKLQSVADQFTADGRKPLSLLLIASSLIFLLAAVNVTAVSIGNTIERSQELSVRLALGAGFPVLFRQLLVQALLFATIGGALGLLFAKLTLAYFLHHFSTAFTRFQETTVDFTVVMIAIAMTFLTSMIAALLPAIYVLKLRPSTQLTAQWQPFMLPRYRLLTRGILIVFEISLASALALVSGLLIKSFYEVKKVDLGFNPAHVFSFQITPPSTRYKDPAQQIALYKTTLEKLVSLPGMRSTSAISSLPLTTQGQINSLEVDAQSPLFGQKLTAEDESILPGFFQTMSLSLLQGRDFTTADQQATPPVVIVDSVLAAKLWPGRNPLGKRIRMSNVPGTAVRWLEVVGVVQEIKHFGPERNVRWMQLYVPQYQDPSPVLSFVVNTALPQAAIKTATEKAVHEIDPNLPLESFESLDAYLDIFLSGRKVSLLLLTAFAAIAIALAAIGIYGVIANAVVQRRREIAIRMAVGATPSRAIVLILRFGLLATLTGVLMGFAIIISLTRLLASLLFGITALDPTIYLLTAVILILLAVFASIVPSIQVLRLNIQKVLRQ